MQKVTIHLKDGCKKFHIENMVVSYTKYHTNTFNGMATYDKHSFRVSSDIYKYLQCRLYIYLRVYLNLYNIQIIFSAMHSIK